MKQFRFQIQDNLFVPSEFASNITGGAAIQLLGTIHTTLDTLSKVFGVRPR